MVSQHVFKSYHTVDGTSVARLHIAQGINNLWLFERENLILDIGPIYDWRSVAPLDNRTECQINVNARHSDPKSRQWHHNLTYPISSYPNLRDLFFTRFHWREFDPSVGHLIANPARLSSGAADYVRNTYRVRSLGAIKWTRWCFVTFNDFLFVKWAAPI